MIRSNGLDRARHLQIAAMEAITHCVMRPALAQEDSGGEKL